MNNIQKNTLFTGDNLHILKNINSQTIDLIYLDPPFNSKRMYKGVGDAAGHEFKDMWTWDDINQEQLLQLKSDYPNLVKYIQSISGMHSKSMMSYITYMAERLMEMHRLLKPTGTLYLHCDPTASHYLKIVLDRLFGQKNFRNEIIWHYDGPQRPSEKNFSSKHDIILRYSASENYYGNTKEKFIISEKELQKKYKQTTDGKWFYDLPRGSYTDKSIQKLKQEGRIRYTKSGNPRIMYFLTQDTNGNILREKVIHDVWNDIISLGAAGSSKEKTGYQTQKPLKLLERIIQTSTNQGDLILDPFCGCATAIIAAQRLNRRWIGIDVGDYAATATYRRLKAENGTTDPCDWDSWNTHQRGLPQRTDIQHETIPKKQARQQLWKQQNGKCNGCNIQLPERTFHLDHIIPKSKGGTDTIQNYQLLCGYCNSAKGNRTMNYLKAKLRKEQQDLENYTF